MKTGSKIKISFLLLLIVCASAVKVFAAPSDFQYTIANSEAKITGISGDVEDLMIPATIGGYKVTTIGEAAFTDGYFKSISIPSTVKTIENKAFFGARVYGNPKIKIPASVEKIGIYAFSYMYGVEAFEVEEGNQEYTSMDGVLFKADKSILMNYPINRSEDTYIVPRETEGLDCTSFASSNNLKHLVIPSESIWMAGYTFFNCDLTLYGREYTNLYYSIQGLEEENYERGKVKFIPIDTSPVSMDLQKVYYGRNTNFFDVPIDLRNNKQSFFISIGFNIPKGKYVSHSVSEGILANIKTDEKGGFYTDYFSLGGFKNSILTLTYQMNDIPNNSIECELSYEDPYERSSYYRMPTSFYPYQTFQDSTRHWAKDAIQQGRSNGALWWVRNDKLKPNQPITRAEFVSSLAMLCNDSLTDSEVKFDDTPENAWYLTSVNWAVKNGIIQGVGNGLFAPDKQITREEIGVLMMRALDYKGIQISTRNYKAFADDHLISEWAKKGTMVMQTSKMMNGVGKNQFHPKGLTTRAEAAVLFQRFEEMLGD